MFFFFNDTATTEIYTLSLHDALPIFAPCLFFALLLQLRRALHSFPKNRGKNRRTRHCKYQQRGQPQFPAPPCRCCCEFHHGNASLGKAMAYSGLNAATPRAMASATPGTIWSSSARSFTTTLETSTAIAGAAVVRSCRMAAVCAASGEPLKCCVSIPCTRSPSFLLSPRNGACARSQGINPFAALTGGRSALT